MSKDYRERCLRRKGRHNRILARTYDSGGSSAGSAFGGIAALLIIMHDELAPRAGRIIYCQGRSDCPKPVAARADGPRQQLRTGINRAGLRRDRGGSWFRKSWDSASKTIRSIPCNAPSPIRPRAQLTAGYRSVPTQHEDDEHLTVCPSSYSFVMRKKDSRLLLPIPLAINRLNEGDTHNSAGRWQSR